jgi:hypothetical protein
MFLKKSAEISVLTKLYCRDLQFAPELPELDRGLCLKKEHPRSCDRGCVTSALQFCQAAQTCRVWSQVWQHFTAKPGKTRQVLSKEHWL